MEFVEISVLGNKKAECLDFEAGRKLNLKINELVDAVNGLQEMCKSCDNQIGILAEQIAKLQHDNSEKANCQENVQDKFAEQRKWIGKLCKFWNFKDGAVDIGILKAVDNLTPTIPYINDIDCSYAYCEPVKPDDDIIYKKEQQ